MTKTLTTLCFFCLVQTSFCQLVLSGKVLIQETSQPIAYVNIGIVNRNYGTLSNPDGTFKINLPSSTINDTIQILALGFERIEVPINSFIDRNNITIRLREQPLRLKEVVISERKRNNKLYEFGNSSFNGGVLETDTAYAGGSTSLLIENSGDDFTADFEFPVYVVKARLRILKNNLPTMKFRIKLNKVDPSTGTPGDDLLQTSIISESAMRKGWLEFDLSNLNLIVTEPFFLTFEQILDVKDRTSIADGYREFMLAHPEKIRIDTIEIDGKKEIRKSLSGNAIDLPGTFVSINSRESGSVYKCFTRETSFGEWTRTRGIVTATITLSDQKPLRSRNTK